MVHNYTDKNNIDRHFGYGSDSTNGHHKVTEPDKPGITLEQYAAAKKLPIEFLQSINLKNTNYDFSPAVRIPYPDELGREVYHRYRVALKGEPRFKAPAKATGAKPIPYGLQVLANARESGYILLVEGESDAQVCWYNDIPALGIPGVQAWKRWGKEWAEHLHNIPIILVPVEADGGGEQFWNLVRTTSSLIGRVGQLPITNRHLKDIGKVWESAVDGGDSSKFKTTVENMVWLTSLTFTPLGNVDVNDVRNPSFFGAVRLVDVEDPGPDNYLVRDMVMDREPTYFYAAEGTCKSLMTTALGVAIASPEVSSIFGHQVETHGPVVLFDAELTVHRFRKRVAEICRGLGVQFPTNIYYKNVVGVSPKISFPELHGLVENVGAIAVVIDSIGFATRGDPESYNDVRNQTTEYIDPLIKQGVAPIVVDHKPHSGDHMIGSVAKGYHGRIIFRVDDKDGDDRTPGERHICLVNKKASFADEGHKVGLTLRFRPGEIQFEYDQTVGAESERRSKPTVEARVLEALTEGDKTKLAIHQHTNTPVTTLSNTLPGMVRSNTIRVVGAEGREYVYGINTTEDKEGLRTSLTSTFPRGVNVNDVDEAPPSTDTKDLQKAGLQSSPLTSGDPFRGLRRNEKPLLISDNTNLASLAGKISGSTSPIAIDTETSSLQVNEAKVRLMQLRVGNETNPVLIDCKAVDVNPLLDVLKDKHLLGHNLAYDLAVLSNCYGYEHLGPVSDTMLMFQVYYGGTNKRANLKDALKAILGIEISKDEQASDWMGELTPEMLEYAATDVVHLHALKDALEAKIDDTAKYLWPVVDLEHRMTKVTAHMGAAGMPVDEVVFAECVQESRKGAAQKLDELDALVSVDIPQEYVKRNTKSKAVPEKRNEKVNWNSSEQVLWVFKKVAGTPLKSTSKETLSDVDHPIAAALLEYRRVLDVSKRFRDTQVVDGRVYAKWNQLKARTGRMSCEKPPLQGIPDPLRRAFVAPKGYKLIVSDLSQIEIRVLATICGDENLREDLASGRDVHRRVAASIFSKTYEEVSDKERKLAKSLVFGTLYGMGLSGFTARVNAMTGKHYSKDKVEREFREPLFAPYPKVKTWMDAVARDYETGNKVSYTRLGRRRLQVPDVPAALNTPIQAGATDVMKAIAVDAYEGRRASWEIVGLVHDEILVLVPEDDATDAKSWLHEVMTRVGGGVVNQGVQENLRVVVDAGTQICDSWAEKV